MPLSRSWRHQRRYQFFQHRTRQYQFIAHQQQIEAGKGIVVFIKRIIYLLSALFHGVRDRLTNLAPRSAP